MMCFANENTSLNPDASVFGPTNLQLTFNLEKITASEVRRVLRTLPNKTSCGSDRISYQMIKEAGPGLVGPSSAFLTLHCGCRKCQMNGGNRSLNRYSRVAGRTDGTHRATGPSHLHPVLQEQWRKSLTPGSLSIFKKIRFSTNTSQDSSGIIRQSHSSVS